jgi:hypothetical protein
MTTMARCFATAYKRWPEPSFLYLASELPNLIQSGWSCGMNSSGPRADDERMQRCGKDL